MQDLRLIGVHEDGLHLLLAGSDGEHYTVPIDDSLRTAARRDRPRLGQLQIDIDGGMRPREVQSLIRAGGSTEEVADRAGWSVDKVRRYEGPILAERAHVADQARLVRVRHRGGVAAGAAPTLQGRVAQRMRDRDVEPDGSSWDAWRAPDATSWTVVLTFAAGGRQRQASWVYDPVLRSTEPLDDEARWLSADEATGAGTAGPLPSGPARVARVYDVEAEGGVAATTRRAASGDRGSADRMRADGPGDERSEEPVDLMTAMRQRTTVGRRSGRRRAEPRTPVAPALPLGDGPGATSEAGATGHVEPVLPVEIAQLEPAGSEVPPAEDAAPAPARPGDPAPSGPAPSDPAPSDPAPSDPVPSDPAADVAPDEAPEPADHEAEAGDDGAPAHTQEAAPEPAPEAEPEAAFEAELAPEAVSEAEPDPEPTVTPGPTAAPKRKARTSVPSWDDIMFGAKRD